MGMQMLVNLGRDSLDLWIIEIRIVDDSVNQDPLGWFNGAVFDALAIDSHVICWMTLIFDVEIEISQFGDDDGQLLVWRA